jgi:hypothetical protein
LQIKGQNWWQLGKSLSHESVCLRLAVVAKYLVGTIKFFHFKQLVQAFSHTANPLHLYNQVQKLLFPLSRYSTLLAYN